MNNVIERLEEQALEEQARSQQRYPCKRCGKPISNRGKRMHDAFCSGSGKTTSRKPSTAAFPTVTVRSRSNFSLKSATPASVVQSAISFYFGWIDYCYKKFINNPFFFWFWLSLLVFSIIMPVYLLQVLWCWTESFFAVIAIFWKAGGNVVGGTVSVTQQLNYLAGELKNTDYTGIVPSAINWLFDSTPNDADKQQVKKLVTLLGNVTMNAVGGMTDMSNAIDAVTQHRDEMKATFFDWGGFGYSIFSNPLVPPAKPGQRALSHSVGNGTAQTSGGAPQTSGGAPQTSGGVAPGNDAK